MLISVNGLSFGYDDVNILQNVNLSINEGDRIGFIGENGAGKSTLLKLLSGELSGYDGDIRRKSGLVIGVLHQNGGVDGERTVYAEALSVFDRLIAAERRLRELETELGSVATDTREYRELIGEYNRLSDVCRAGDADHINVKIDIVLNGMGFAGSYERIVSTLSGGEKTRLALCKLLLTEPELLIMDEPTNHLDIATLAWLERYLDGYKKALLIVSHDRFFLDKTVRKIWELEQREVSEYKGNYSKYKILKEEEVKTAEREYEKQQLKIAQMTEYAERNIARASTSNSAKSRLHQLANMEQVAPPKRRSRPPMFRFDIDHESAKDVVRVVGLTLRAGDKVLATDVSFDVKRGDRIAVVGPNGSGKSTLIKTMLGLVGGADETAEGREKRAGSVSVGERALLRGVNCHVVYGKDVSISYYDQENDNLNVENMVLEELWFRFSMASQTDMRASLAAAQLTADDMDKRVSELSGGERAKLGLVIVKEERSNLIFLDEPTNHLDLGAREALEKGLLEYAGTLIFVSHDRYFINMLATSILELDNGKATLYAGGYEWYLAQKETATSLPQERKTVKKSDTSSSFRSKEARKAQVRLKSEIALCEQLISECEGQRAELYADMCSGRRGYAELREIEAQYNALGDQLQSLYEEWERLNIELEEVSG